VNTIVTKIETNSRFTETDRQFFELFNSEAGSLAGQKLVNTVDVGEESQVQPEPLIRSLKDLFEKDNVSEGIVATLFRKAD